MVLLSIPTLAAISTSILGTITLRAAWRKQSAIKPVIIVAGWSLLVLGFPLWSKVAGPEYGSAFHCIIVSLIAWLLVLLQAEKNPRKKIAKETQAAQSDYSVPHKLWLLIVAGPIACVANCSLLLLATQALPTDRANQLVITAILFPLFWAGYAAWICAHRRLALHSVALIICSVGCTSFLFL